MIGNKTYRTVVGPIFSDLTEDGIVSHGGATSFCARGHGGIEIVALLAAVLDHGLLLAEHVEQLWE